MKIQHYISAFLLILTVSCKEDVQPVSHEIGFSFIHNVGTEALTTNTIGYTNEAGNEFSVETLQYLVSNIRLNKNDGKIIEIEGYHLVDIYQPGSETFSPGSLVEAGNYSGISFVFGFDEADNISGEYPDLNLANWNWPDMLGGGYHFMKLEGKFIDEQQNEVGYATHMGTAREISGNESIFHPNHFEVTILQNFTIDSETSIEIKMDILKWYKTPNLWDLNTWGAGIMPNYDAQVALNQNGQDVFSLGDLIKQ